MCEQSFWDWVIGIGVLIGLTGWAVEGVVMAWRKGTLLVSQEEEDSE